MVNDDLVNNARGGGAGQADAEAQLELLRAQIAAFEAQQAQALQREQELRQQLEQIRNNDAANRVVLAPGVAGIAGVPRNEQVLDLGLSANRVDNYRVPKLPVFMKSNPQVWFGQVEASFRNARITNQRTMADTIIATLEPGTAELITDIIVNPDPTTPYTHLKERLLALYGESPEARLRRLLRGQVDTRGKPSHIFAQIRAHAADCSDAVLRSIFLEHMPEQLRGLLVASNKESLQEIAQFADLLAEAMGLCSAQTFEIKKPELSGKSDFSRSSTPTRDTFSELVKEIRDLKVMLVEKPHSRGRSRYSANRSGGNKKPNRSKSRSNDPSELCRFHKKFAENAYYCIQPCAWQGSPPTGKPKN